MTDYYFYPYIALTGGADGALDSLDGSLLKDGDAAIVVVPGTKEYYAYTLDADSGLAESSPDVISPDANAGLKRWVRTNASVDSKAAKVAGATLNNYAKLKADGDLADSGVAAGDCTKIATRTVATTAPNTNQLIGYSGAQWEPRAYGIVYSGANVFSGTSPNAYTDLDLSAVVGANRAYVILKLICTSASLTVKFRTNGSSLDQGAAAGYGGGLTSGLYSQNYEIYIMVLTDAAGVIEWWTSAASSGTTVDLIAYVRL
jgi:hypothetical protein